MKSKVLFKKLRVASWSVIISTLSILVGQTAKHQHGITPVERFEDKLCYAAPTEETAEGQPDIDISGFGFIPTKPTFPTIPGPTITLPTYYYDGPNMVPYYEQPEFVKDYFSNLTTNYPRNNVGNCGYVAAAMLLSYYDTYWNPGFIPDQYNNQDMTELDSLGDKVFDSPGVNDIYEVKYGDSYSAKLDYLNRMLARQDESFVALLYQKAIDVGTLDPSVDPGTGTCISSIVEFVNLYISENEAIAGKAVLKFEEYRNTGGKNHEEQREILREKAVSRLKKGQPLIFGGDTHTGNGHICIAYAYDEVNDQIIIHKGWSGRDNNMHVSASDFLNFNDFAYLDVFSSLRSVPDNKRFKVGNKAYSCHDLDSFVHKETAVAYQDEDFHALQCSCGKVKYEKHDFVSIGSNTKKCNKCGKMVSKPEWSY
ncbi:MAG: hypothetical protein J6328_01225 [Bacilli bacterium]|nr:hypothetical protein [Bacilli bacterium]